MTANMIILCFECGEKNNVPDGAMGAACGKCAAPLKSAPKKTLRAEAKYPQAPSTPGKIKRKVSLVGQVVRYSAICVVGYFFFGAYIPEFSSLSKLLKAPNTEAEVGREVGVMPEGDSAKTSHQKWLEATQNFEITPDLKQSKIVPLVYDEEQKSEFKKEFITLNLSDRKNIQTGLQIIGYYSSSIDGLWGVGTEKAVITFGENEKIDFDPKNLYTQLIARAVSTKTAELWYASTKKRQARFSVKVGEGNDYFIKLRAVDTKIAILAAYIKGGDIYETKVPLGRFELVYATGDKWLGEEELFGEKTSRRKSDTTMVFEISGNKIMGQRVSLIKVKSGNLTSTNLNNGDF